MAGRGASRQLFGRDYTTMSRETFVRRNNDAVPLVSNAPRSRVIGLPTHLVSRPGPLAVPPLNRRNVPSTERGDVSAPSEAGKEYVASSKGRVPLAVEGAGEQQTPAAVKEPSSGTSAAAESDHDAPLEQDGQEELNRIQSKLALWDLEEREAQTRRPPVVGMQPFRTSDQIHVMGMDLAGRYIAHTLAGCQTIPPVRYMLHTHYLFRQWRECGKQLTLYRGYDRITRRRIVGEWTQDELAETRMGGTIYNLIVTVPASHVVRAIGQIRHRLDYRSTICLINDGFGVAEELIERYFPDELTRPIFLLGHLSANLGHTDKYFSVSEVRPGRLFLSLFSAHRPEVGGRFRIKRHPPLERTTRATHLIRLLTAMPGLHATGHPMPDFLRYKLPTAAFRTVADPLAVLFDCRYDQILSNPYARHLMDRLIGELSHILSRLPECRHSEKFRRFASTASLRDEVLHKLALKRTADSRMRWQVSQGWDTDVDYLSGYFVKRGRELQASVTTLESITAAAKARQIITSERLENDIPFERAYSA